MLYTYQTGSSASPAIVFLHGGGLSGRMWQPQWERLEHDYYCLAPDLPEQGRSLHNGPFSLDSAAEQVLEIIRECVPARKVHLVGLSLGGAIALTMMRIAPEYIDHVIVSGTAAGLGKLLGTIGRYGGVIYKFVKPETLIEASVKQFAVPEQYRAIFREDILLTSNAVFNEHTFTSLMAMQLPCASAIPTLVCIGERENAVAKLAARKLTTVCNAHKG